MKSLLRRAKIIVRALVGQEVLVRPDVSAPSIRLGAGDCAWDVLPDELGSDSVVYSFGVGEDVTFDLALIDRYGMKVHAFDPTPKSIAWARAQRLPEAFVLHEVGLASYDGTATFHPPVDPTHVSHTILARPETQGHAITVQVRTLESLMEDLGHDRIDLLKMDIEGAEYAVIDALVESGIRPRQLLVEFHHRFPGVGPQKTRDAIARIRGAGYRLFSVSEKNEEFGFLAAR